MNPQCKVVIFLALFLTAAATPWAAGPPAGGPGSGWSFSAALTPLYQGDAGLEGGGEFSVERLFFNAGAGRHLGKRWHLGLSLTWDYDDFDFEGAYAPWDTVHRFGLGATFSRSLSDGWRVTLGPSFEYAGESGASDSDSLGWGGFVSVTKRFSRDLMLGIGGGFYDRLETVSAFPFLAVYWRITPQLTLTNPLRVGPSGPAGLELVYDLGAGWKLGAGGAWRSFRFRLDEEGANPGGIGESESLPVWGRVSREFGPKVRLDLYAGAMVDGRLRLEDPDGNDLSTVDHDSAPFVGLTLTGKF